MVGEADDGLKVGEIVSRLNPNVLVLDLMMPGLNGLEVIRQVRQRSPSVRIVVLSMHDHESYVLEALRNGAVGYVLKGSSVEILMTAIRTAREDQRFLSPTLTGLVPPMVSQRELESAPDPYDTVTLREREVLQLAAEGYSNEAIAARLSISRRTAELHRAHVLFKLSIHNQTGLVRYAIRKGLVSLDNRSQYTDQL